MASGRTLIVARGRPGEPDFVPIHPDDVRAIPAGWLARGVSVDEDALGLRVRLGTGGTPVFLWWGDGYLYSGSWEESAARYIPRVLGALGATGWVDSGPGDDLIELQEHIARSKEPEEELDPIIEDWKQRARRRDALVLVALLGVDLVGLLMVAVLGAAVARIVVPIGVLIAGGVLVGATLSLAGRPLQPGGMPVRTGLLTLGWLATATLPFAWARLAWWVAAAFGG